jgi:hypothetical protein
LKILQHSTNIVFESLGESGDILVGEQVREIDWFGRITSKDFNLRFLFENTRNFVAGEENGRTPIVPCHPFHEFPLSVWIRPVYLVQNDTGVSSVSAKKTRNTHRMLRGLY